eukprot:11180288-Lingulodinium_polyedra.AAC.1
MGRPHGRAVGLVAKVLTLLTRKTAPWDLADPGVHMQTESSSVANLCLRVHFRRGLAPKFTRSNRRPWRTR